MRLTPVALAVLAAVAACGGDDGGSSSGTGFAAMLADVPAAAVEGELPMLSYVDMELLWSQLGVAPDADDDARLDAYAATPANGRFVVPPRLFDQQSLMVDAAREEVGFDVLDVRRELAIDAPPSELRLVDVAVDAATIEEAVAADPTWRDRLRTVEHETGTYFDWTPGGDADRELETDPVRRTPMRPLGIGGQLAVEDRGDDVRVVRTKESTLMLAALARRDGDGESAAEEGPFAGADAALEGDVLQVVGVGGSIEGTPAGLSPEQQAQLDAQVVHLEPYQAILVAEIVEDEATRVEVVLLHDDEDDAAANEAAVRTLIAEGFTMSGRPAADLLPGATVEADGTVVRVTTEGGDLGHLYQALVRRDLFVTR